MTEIVKSDNKYYKEYDMYIKTHYFKFSKDNKLKLFEYMLLEKSRILKTKQIDVSKVLKNAPTVVTINKARLHDCVFIPELVVDLLMEFVKKYEVIENNRNIVSDRKDYDYRESQDITEYNAKVKDELKIEGLDSYEILPNSEYTYQSFIKNLFANIYAKHLFNEILEKQNCIKDTDEIQHAKFRVLNFIEEIEYPIIYKIECNQCNNIALYTELDMANQIKCDLNMNNNVRAAMPRHVLSSNKGILNKGITLYGYLLELEKEPGVFKAQTEIFYFTELLNASMIDAQFIRYSGMAKQTKGNRIFIVLSYKNENMNSVVPYDIITTDSNKHNFVEDIYESVKKYNKKEHNILIRDNNKIISEYIIFCLLAQLFHAQRFFILVLGESGAGKTWLAKILPKHFTSMHTTLNGASVSKNRFLGGSGTTSTLSGNRFQKGVVGTHDFVICEESSNALNNFNMPNSEKTNNLFSMIKICSEDKVPITTQDTQEYDAIASLYVDGNIEQINSTRDYQKKVSLTYKKSNGDGEYQSEWPLFRPISYYKEVLKNEKLARAHYIVRKLDSEYASRNYITKLPPAEMARFSFFVTIENDKETEFSEFKSLNEKHKDIVHREQIIKELSRRFKKFEIKRFDNKECNNEITSFIEEIYNYLLKEFFQKRQNFRVDKRDINNHIKNSIRNIANSFFIFQKQFYSEPYTLTDHDKAIFERFMKFNYNTLSVEETTMSKEPYFNDYFEIDKSLILNENISDMQKARDAQIAKETEEVFAQEMIIPGKQENIFSSMNEFASK